jgi:hypothetical protein
MAILARLGDGYKGQIGGTGPRKQKADPSTAGCKDGGPSLGMTTLAGCATSGKIM